MGVTLMVHLFGKPGQELDEGSEVTGQQIRELADHLAARLREDADTVDKLTGAGWQAEMALYDVILSHPYVSTEAETLIRLNDLGIDPEAVCIFEFEDEDEDIDEDFEPGEE